MRSFFEELWSATADLAPQESDLIMRASRPDDQIWCEDDVRLPRDESALRNSVESLFRSISSPRSRASRAVTTFSDRSAAPGLVVQSFTTSSWSVSSRHPRTGAPVDDTNWADSIVGNRLPDTPSLHIDLALRCEKTLRRPVQVYFDASTDPRVTTVESAIMADTARFEALAELLHSGHLDPVGLLRQIQPWMFGYLQKYELDPARSVAIVRGVDAAPGQVFGLVALRQFDRRRFSEVPPVLFLDEATPNDVQDINASAAVVSAVGGKSSHAAVMCRRIGMPCVVGTGVRPQEKKRYLLLPDGIQIREHTPVAVDAILGVIDFSDSPTIVPKYSILQHRAEILALFADVLAAETTSPKFSRLSIEDQKHLAALKHRLRELRLLQ